MSTIKILKIEKEIKKITLNFTILLLLEILCISFQVLWSFKEVLSLFKSEDASLFN